MTKLNPTIVWIFRGIIAFLFVFSAISKLFPIEAFEKQLVDLKITNWCLAPALARAIIAWELFLGLCFLQNHFFKKFIIPLTVGLLVAFCIHLGYQIFLYGNEGNCGCMGQLIPMTPLQAIIKNIIALILIGIIYLNTPNKKNSLHRYPTIILIICYVFIFGYFQSVCCCDTTPILPTIWTNTNTDTTNTLIDNQTISTNDTAQTLVNQPATIKTKKDSTKKNTPINTPISTPSIPKTVSVFAPYTQFSGGKTVNLDEGKKLVCVFNTMCDHCMDAAKKITELAKTTKTPPVYVLFWSENNSKGEKLEKEIEEFYKYAGNSYPYTVIETPAFFRLLGNAPSPPRIAVLSEGNVVGDFSEESLTKEALTRAYNF